MGILQEVMTPSVISIDPNKPIGDALLLMEQQKISALAVVEGNNQ